MISKAAAVRGFATHARVAIVGGGTGGVSVSAQLINSGHFKPEEITVFDPSEKHYYQPSFTMVSGGVIGNAEEAAKKEKKYVWREMPKMFKKGVKVQQKSVEGFDLEHNAVVTEGGDKHHYDYLVLAAGVKLRYDLIEGSAEALADPNSPCGSMYRLDYAYKMSRLREGFKGGKAIFTLPMMPVKCGGAPQKIMYLSEETWRNNGVRDKADIHFYTCVGNMFPNCLKYADKLGQIVKEKDINVHFQH